MTSPIRIELPTIFPMKTVNTWLFKGTEPTLIDCGENTDAVWQALEKGLNKHQLTLNNISRVVITHAHVDHMGMAGRIAQATGAEIWVSDLVYDWARNKDSMWKQRADLITGLIQRNLSGSKEEAEFFNFMQGFLGGPLNIWSDIPPQSLKRFPVDATLQFNGQPWHSIHAPGHCANQTIFHHRDSASILGADMLLKLTSTPVIEPDPDNPSQRTKGLHQILQSYEMVKNMKISRVFPGHYEIIDNPMELIEAQIARIHHRKDQCFEMIQSGKNALWELFQGMYQQKLHLPGLSMLIGYLDILQEEGKVIEGHKIGKKGYHTTADYARL